MIRWKFAKNKPLKIENFAHNFKDKQMCTVKPYYILFERLRLFAVRLPSLSVGNGLLGCGITFDIFAHVLHGSIIFVFFNILFYNLQYLKKGGKNTW